MEKIISGSDDKTIKVWDMATGKLLTDLEGHEKSVTCVSFSANGYNIVSGSDDKTIKIWDIETGDEL